MTIKPTDFSENLPLLLQLLADPVTPHTAQELWCRIGEHQWEKCIPALHNALEHSDPSVIQLVLSILNEQADVHGSESLEDFLPDILACLKHDDRLVRSGAIILVQEVHIADDSVIQALKGIVLNDEPLLAREALIALLNVDWETVTEVVALFRSQDS